MTRCYMSAGISAERLAEIDATLDALHATLQRAEYRTPYTVPTRWPLYDCPHEWIDIGTLCAPSESLCVLCSEVRR